MKPEYLLRTIHERGTNNPSVVSSGDKSQMMLLGASAVEYYLPPMARKRLSPDMMQGEVPRTLLVFK